MTYMDPMGSGKGEKLVPNKNLRHAFILAKLFFQLQNFALGESSQLGTSCAQKNVNQGCSFSAPPKFQIGPEKDGSKKITTHP